MRISRTFIRSNFKLQKRGLLSSKWGVCIQWIPLLLCKFPGHAADRQCAWDQVCNKRFKSLADCDLRYESQRDAQVSVPPKKEKRRSAMSKRTVTLTHLNCPASVNVVEWRARLAEIGNIYIPVQTLYTCISSRYGLNWEQQPDIQDGEFDGALETINDNVGFSTRNWRKNGVHVGVFLDFVWQRHQSALPGCHWRDSATFRQSVLWFRYSRQTFSFFFNI